MEEAYIERNGGQDHATVELEQGEVLVVEPVTDHPVSDQLDEAQIKR
jgi:hypothetical protein